MIDLMRALSEATLHVSKLSDIPKDGHKPFVQLYSLLGEPFLLALDLLDHERLSQLSLDDQLTDVFLCSGVKGTSTEIRLCAWHCTCTHFALESYKAYMSPSNEGSTDDLAKPTCKHLIACQLARHAGPLFRARQLAAQDWLFV
ncbi:hypothetical protein BCR37DRAFT_108782 [Protomyces lactucae-debilis]|uniref:SWIM-type domain-containing protein n=1 Tax=Protomyces lactucae-debilis TaxID=2754530 RepID=A0A1Y2F415_PROLT|nr:uncharacterized protein BCR37DRAFT_108782 [Protomyces lactucae-debilis]ORY78593.1 hypothetical protein BCR37DRAFT_108782 [Protomyces lactucae-debilis]